MENKVALITGAAKRLGKEIAISLSKNKYKIVINYLHSYKEAQKLVKIIGDSGNSAIAVQSDVRKKSDVSRLFKIAFKRYGRIDILINNAGIFEKVDFRKLNEAKWNKTLDTNLKSCLYCSLEAAKYMQNQGEGKIINISSLGGIKPYKGYLPYCVSKAGVIMLTKCLAKELAPDILVNGIAPGIIQFENDSKNILLPDVEKIPLKKYALPKDITELILYLANSVNYITGQTFIIDGGRILN